MNLEEIYTKAANGNKDYQFKFACHYIENEDCKPSMKKSIFWLKEAAKQGHLEAMYSLGLLFENPLTCVGQDYKQAIYWYTKAANKGHRQSQFQLGFFHQYGYGVEKNLDTALNWYLKKESKDHIPSKNAAKLIIKEKTRSYYR